MKHESVVDDIEGLSWLLVVAGAGVSELAMSPDDCLLWSLSNILGEDVSWLVDIGAEFEVVSLSDVAHVKIFTNEELEEVFSGRDELELLKNTSKLLSSDMAVASTIIVLELRLNQDAFILNLISDSCQESQNGVFFGVGEV